ncbi:hypothetical protein R1flu_014311 [Riccia fluitans]|uniref:Transmembrane protein n=1 Tax=Riccia fluitans TaxID=41844 RepID=A0ABD1YG37_9MARC
MGDDNELQCAMGCCMCWGAWGGFAAGVLFIVFGIFALVAAGPFGDKSTTLGIVLVVLGATGVGSVAGYLFCGLPCFCIGFCIDKAMDAESEV